LFAADPATDTVSNPPVPATGEPVAGAPRRPREEAEHVRRPDRDRGSRPVGEYSSARSNRTEPARVPESGSRRRAEDVGETWPELPEWATPDALDADARRDLRGLSKDNATWVAAHLVAAGTFADEDPETAWWHARAARARGGRIAVVRETVGLVAYRAGEWAEAIGELRAARRMGGGPGHLAVLADCERALGHPEKAIELARSEQAGELEEDGRIELATVVAGARADLGQIDAGLAHLEQFDVRERSTHPRLAYAYADLLDRAGRQPEALTWFIRAANADVDEDTDALERVEALAATVDAETTDPVPDTAPIAPDAGPADSAATEPGPAEAGATEPGPAEAGATEPGAAEAGATVDNGAALDPGVEETETGESDPTEPVGDVSQVLFSDDQQ
jgi:hypothetical protein